MAGVEILFWSALACIFYTYLGSPLLTLLRGLVWRRPYRSEPITPTVSLVICCHNEEGGIEAKLLNVLSLDYPTDRLQVLIASDGSTDRTEEIVSRYESDRIRLLRLPRTGKAGALNEAVANATGEILVFSDANSIYREDAIRQLVQSFADERVGGVAGNQVYSRNASNGLAASGEQRYWSLDRWMKELQTRSGNAISATGAIYAIRRRLFRPVPEGGTDDFVTSTNVIRQGRRLVFEPAAICYEPVAGSTRAEFRRKVRVITRGLRSVIEMRALLNPFRYGFYSIQLFSHKVLRRLVVFAVLAIALTSPLLWHEGILFQLATLAQTAVYAAAFIGWLYSRTGRKAPAALAVPVYFCMINAAVLVATWNIVRGKRVTLWNPQRDLTPDPSPLSPRSVTGG